ncbi:MAG: hypothetical protein ACOC6R_04015 [Chloroflexota bacterium]
MSQKYVVPQPQQITPDELRELAWCCCLWLASCSMVMLRSGKAA